MIIGITPFYSSNRENLYENIKKGDLKFGLNVSEEVKDLIKQLLKKNPKKRLGASIADAEEIKAHPFFNSVNWDDVIAKNVIPPPVRPIARMLKHIPLALVYGDLSEDESFDIGKINGWSVLEKNNE